MPDAEGDNCRRASLLRCSCKEVLRRDKAPAITIEPRGNSLPTCHTHARTHMAPRVCALALALGRRIRRVKDLKEARACIFFASFIRLGVCVKKFAVARMGEKRRRKKKLVRRNGVSGKICAASTRAFCAPSRGSVARPLNIKPPSFSPHPVPSNILLNKVRSKQRGCPPSPR